MPKFQGKKYSYTSEAMVELKKAMRRAASRKKKRGKSGASGRRRSVAKRLAGLNVAKTGGRSDARND